MQNANADDLKKEAPPQRRTFQFGLSRRSMLPAVAGLIISILIGLVIHASYRNADKYYLIFAAGALEIWQGTFSPSGKKRILIMPGVQKPGDIKTVYTKEAVYPLAFNFYVSKADARLGEVAGWTGLIAAGLLLPDGKPRRLYAEAGLARALGEVRQKLELAARQLHVSAVARKQPARDGVQRPVDGHARDGAVAVHVEQGDAAAVEHPVHRVGVLVGHHDRDPVALR